MQNISEGLRMKDKKIGFVPTMGYLHKGHLKLVKECRKRSDVVIVSIFVNPVQFGPKEDFNSYPRDLNRDIEMLKKLNVDYIFIPDVKEMYPKGYSVYVEPTGGIVNSLCGFSRPGHFRGVATVVAKLFNIVKPHISFFGKKDFQQSIVIKRIVKDLNFSIDIVIVKTVREKDGLAMSSRNKYLSDEERKSALVLYKSLNIARNMIKSGERKVSIIINSMKEMIKNEHSAKINYISIVNADTLEKLKEATGNVLIALAVKIGKTRLIDNLTIKC